MYLFFVGVSDTINQVCVWPAAPVTREHWMTGAKDSPGHVTTTALVTWPDGAADLLCHHGTGAERSVAPYLPLKPCPFL